LKKKTVCETLKIKMSICAYPQVRIYEDFDKMSAKEVYYNEAGNKITVKLLHFPDVKPEDINKMKFEDDDNNVNAEQNNSNALLIPNCCDLETPLTTEAEEEEDDEEIEADNEKEADDADSNQNCNLTLNANKKFIRRKSSSNIVHSRKCSMAFAQAHGIQTPSPPATPIISLPPFSASESSILALRKQNLNSQNKRALSPASQTNSLCPGYAQYSKSLLEVPLPRDYGYASSDDLSSEWDSDVSTTAGKNLVHQKKVSFVQCFA